MAVRASHGLTEPEVSRRPVRLAAGLLIVEAAETGGSGGRQTHP